MQVTQIGQTRPFVKVHHRNGRVFMRIVESATEETMIPLTHSEATRLAEILAEHARHAAETLAKRAPDNAQLARLAKKYPPPADWQGDKEAARG